MATFAQLSGYNNTLPGYIPHALDSLEPSEQNVAADNTVIPIVYGRQRVQAKIASVTKDANNNLVVCCIWCLGEVEAIENVLVDSKFTSTYTGITKVDYTGTTSQLADPTLAALLPSYTDTLVASNFGYDIGVCYSVITINKGEVEAFPTFEAIIQGRKVYDPRDGGQIEGTPSTWLYSTNPSLCIADFIASKEYGWDKSVDYTTVGDCADFNDEVVPTTSILRHEINISIDSVSPTDTTVEAFRAYAHCFVVFEGATVKLVKDDIISYTPTEINEDTILSLALKKNNITDLPTVYRVEYTDNTIEDVDTEGEWGTSEAVVYASGVEAGTTQRRETVISMYGYTNYNQALREAIQRINYYNIAGLYVTWRATDEALVYQVGDVVNITHQLGITSQSFRITEIRPLDLGRWNIVAQEYDASIYSDDNTTTGVTPAYGKDLTFDTTPDIPTGLTHSQVTTISNSGKVDVVTTLTWGANTGNPVTGYTVGYKNTTDGATEYSYHDVNETQSIIPESLEEKTLDAVVRANYGKRTSDFSPIYNFSTVGDTVAPTAPLNFAVTDNRAIVDFTWDLPPEADYSHVEIVYSATSAFPTYTDINDDISMIHGQGNIVTWGDTPPESIGYFWARSVDTTGNKSAYVPPHTLPGEEGSTIFPLPDAPTTAPTNFRVSGQVTTYTDGGEEIITTTLAWDAVANATSYTMQWDNTTKGTTGHTYTTTGTSAKLDEVMADQVLVGRIKAENESGESAYSTPDLTVNTGHDTTGPSSSTFLTASDNKPIVAVDWDIPTEADYKESELWASFTNDRNVGLGLMGTVKGTNFTDSTIDPGTVGYFWVRHIDNVGNYSAWYPLSSTAGEEGSTVTGNIAPGVPTWPGSYVTYTTEKDDDGKVQVYTTVLWDAPTVDENGDSPVTVTSYIISYRLNGTSDAYAEYPISDTSIRVDLGLINQTFDVRVKAINDGAEGAWSTVQVVTTTSDTAAPGIPAGLSSTQGLDNVVLNWTNPGDPDLSHIEIWWSATNNSGAAIKVDEATGTSYHFPELDAGLLGYFWVKSVDTVGNISGFSSGVSGTTSGLTARYNYVKSTKSDEWVYNNGVFSGGHAKAVDHNALYFDTTVGTTSWAETNPMALGNNAVHTVSFIADGAGDGSTNVRAYFLDNLGASYHASLNIDITSQPVEYSMNFTTNSNADGSTIRFFFDLGTDTAAHIYNIKVEQGSVASALTPNELDQVTLGNKLTRLNAIDFMGTEAISAREILADTITANEIWSGYIYTNNLSAGQITSGDISLSGYVKAEGAYADATWGNVAIVGNTSMAQRNGIIGYTNDSVGIGVFGHDSSASTNSAGIRGQSVNGSAVYGQATGSSGISGKFYHGGSGTAVDAYSSTGTAIHCNGDMGKTGTVKVANLNSDYLDGYTSADFCRVANCDTGSASTSSSTLTFTSTVTNIDTSGSGSTVTFYDTTSDARVKQNILPEELGLSFISALKPVTYKYYDTSKTDKVQHGLLAQDVLETLEGIGFKQEQDAIVGIRKDTGLYTLSYTSLITPLIKAVQELTEEVNTLKQQIKEIKECLEK